ncbi:SDR family NAD(P)-dependent oxidoreductase [Sutcliffiella cohnii]|uniref:SDR family NAD(P)-dependent oxidoreductase n=1 Tax=Sutcliffiella cohnii TaxID=33932 RepID=UPI002E22756F|nr:SDR family NAD(P)-dependent oxidoreductase [Sutcliffiella cohnii]
MKNHSINRAVVVTASSKGIGKAVAKSFAAKGDRVMLFGRNEDTLKLASNEIEVETGYPVLYTVGNMSNSHDIKLLFENCVQHFSTVDVLFLNTGRPLRGRFLTFNDNDWQEAFEETFLSYIRIIRNFLPLMQKHSNGFIIANLSAAIFAMEDAKGYYFSNTFRSAFAQFIKEMQCDLLMNNISINGIAPRNMRENEKGSRIYSLEDYTRLVQSICIQKDTPVSGSIFPVGVSF